MPALLPGLDAFTAVTTIVAFVRAKAATVPR